MASDREWVHCARGKSNGATDGGECYFLMISMPSMVALSVTVVNLITICPEELAVVLNSRRSAL